MAMACPVVRPYPRRHIPFLSSAVSIVFRHCRPAGSDAALGGEDPAVVRDVPAVPRAEPAERRQPAPDGSLSVSGTYLLRTA